MGTSTEFVISKGSDSQSADSHDSPSVAQTPTPSTAVLTCILVFTKDSEPFLAILKKLTGDSAQPERVNATAILKAETPSEQNDVWLQHNEAAEYLGISKSTLYRYAEQRQIESRKLGNRLEYRRPSLDKFKDQHIRPTRRSPRGRGIIATALSSGN